MRFGPVTAFTIPTGGTPPGTGSATAVLKLALSATATPGASVTDTIPVTVIADGSLSTIDPSLTITDYKFDFGDATSVHGRAMHAVHTYPTAGSYTITLTCTDSNGGVNSTTAAVTANALGAFDVTIALGDNVATKWNAAGTNAKISIAAGNHTTGVTGITPKAGQVVIGAGSSSTTLNGNGQNAYAFATSNPNNVKIRGIKFSGYRTTDREQGAVRIVGASNCTGWRLSDITIDSCGATSTTAGCFSTFQVSDLIMDGYVISNGPNFGYTGQLNNSILANGEVHHCGASSNVNVYSDTGGGGKMNRSYKLRFLREYRHDCTGQGLWFDDFNGDTDIRDGTYQNNSGAGIMFEINNSTQLGSDQHASVGINGSSYSFQLWGLTMGGNGGSEPSGASGDVRGYDSDKVDVQYCNLADNSGFAAVCLVFSSRPEGGQIKNWQIKNNDIRAASGSGAIRFSAAFAGGSGTPYTPTGMVIDNNRFFMDNGLTATGYFWVPASTSSTSATTISGWRSQGYDGHSSVSVYSAWPH